MDTAVIDDKSLELTEGLTPKEKEDVINLMAEKYGQIDKEYRSLDEIDFDQMHHKLVNFS